MLISFSGESACFLFLFHYRLNSRTVFGKGTFPNKNVDRLKSGCATIWTSVENITEAAAHQESLPEFLGKLREKRQTKTQQDQAACAIRMFYEIVDGEPLRQQPRALGDSNVPSKLYIKESVTQGFVREASSGHRGVRGASHEELPLPKRGFRQEKSENDQIGRNTGSIPSPMAAPTPRRAVGIEETKQPEKTVGPSTVATAQTTGGGGTSWVAEYETLANEIKVRHYSPKTLHAYRG